LGLILAGSEHQSDKHARNGPSCLREIFIFTTHALPAYCLSQRFLPELLSYGATKQWQQLYLSHENVRIRRSLINVQAPLDQATRSIHVTCNNARDKR